VSDFFFFNVNQKKEPVVCSAVNEVLYFSKYENIPEITAYERLLTWTGKKWVFAYVKHMILPQWQV